MNFLLSYKAGWVAWIVMFLAIEGKAIYEKNWSGTFTNTLKEWVAMDGKPSGWRWRRGAFGVFTVWLILHFWA